MRYRNVIPAAFIDRPNRFIAHVEIGGRRETVHVKNTGRCRELLLPGAEVFLAGAENPERKTAWDLIAVRKSNGLLVNRLGPDRGPEIQRSAGQHRQPGAQRRGPGMAGNPGL